MPDTITMTSQTPPPAALPGSAQNPHDITLTHDYMTNAHTAYAELRTHCPVARARFSEFQRPAPQTESERQHAARTTIVPNVWLLTRYDDAVTMLLNDAGFSVNPLSAMSPEQRAALPPNQEFLPLSRSLLTLDPPDHTRLRRLVQPWFSGRTIETLRPRITAIGNDLLDEADAAASARGEASPDRALELVQAFAYPLPVMVISDMLGIPRADMLQIHRWAEALFAGRGPNLGPDQRASIDAFAAYLRALMEQKRRDPGEDLTTFLVNAEDAGDRLDANKLLSMLFVVYVAGHITTVNLIGNAVVALLTHPEQMAKLRANPDLTRNAIEETLRFWGPAEMTFPRVALDDVEIAGVTIPRTERVTVSLAAADRDPAKFAEPDRFDIERPDANRHIAFGKGIHVCLGAPLARAEGEIALRLLLDRYPDLRLAADPQDLRYRDTFLRGFTEIPLLV